MRNAAISKTPTSASRKQDGNELKITDSGKKLVQARLPFKIISSPSTATRTVEIDDDIIVLDNHQTQAKKRKLTQEAYEGENIKDNKNVLAHNSEQCASSSSSSSSNQPVECNKKTKIESIDNDNVSIMTKNNDNNESKVVSDTKIKIKLPLSGKKAKRRKSMRNMEGNDDREISPSFKLNPQKRTKLDSTISIEIDDDMEVIKNDAVLETNAEENKKVINEVINMEDKEEEEEEEENLTTCQTKNSQSSEEAPAEVTVIKSSSSADEPEETVDDDGAGVKKKPLTAKQLKLMEQRRQVREEKERKLLEEKQVKQLEKEKREEAKKLEREQREEQRRKEREEKDERKRLEREEKERKRQAEFAAKNEEKRKRTEAKEEELREKEEERKRKDEEKNLNLKKAAEVFTKFFVPKTNATTAANKGEVDNNLSDEELNLCPSSKKTLAFRPFQVKGAMKLAPICRRQFTAEQHKNLDSIMQENYANDVDSLYLNELRLGKLIPIRWKKPTSNELKESNSEVGDDDVLIVGE